MKDPKAIATLIIQDYFIEHENDNLLEIEGVKLYQKTLDSLLYLTNDTRYDIAFDCQYFD